MYKIVLPILALTYLASCNSSEKSAPSNLQAVNESQNLAGNSYGSSFVEENTISATDLQNIMVKQDSVQAIITAEVLQSCQSKGCWMDVKLNDSTSMKVTFRDYGFFLPIQDLKGKQVVFTGTAKREEISVEDQRHFAKDAGVDDAKINLINSPKVELRFVADGIILK
jgi:hypothetical protein